MRVINSPAAIQPRPINTDRLWNRGDWGDILVYFEERTDWRPMGCVFGKVCDPRVPDPSVRHHWHVDGIIIDDGEKSEVA